MGWVLYLVSMIQLALLLTLAPALLQDVSTSGSTGDVGMAVALHQGPFIGHVTPDSAQVWARTSSPGKYVLAVTDSKGVVTRASATADAESDNCVVFDATGLVPNMGYTYAIESEGGTVIRMGEDLVFRTAPAIDADCDVRLMFASCAREDEATGLAWRQAATQKPDAVVLLGDTPYIDRPDLDYLRKRYAAFAAFPPMADLLRTTPWYGTWDDHDFGIDDTDGRVKGKKKSRRAFVEYHANPSYGNGKRGIYTKFRRGPVEVFLLDTRTYAAMEPSPFLGHHASLLGADQWKWLLKGLESSTAPVKILACGMIWNGATRPGKLDHWGSYPYEREALFKHIGKHKIQGVTLVGGDIHRSRVIRHASAQRAGYDIIELIVSPMHDSIIAAANAPHPGLVKDMGEPRTFLLLDAKQQGGELRSLSARFVNAKGTEHFSIDLRNPR